jgi:hypothetical protein
MGWIIPNTAFGGHPNLPDEDDMQANDWAARKTQFAIGKLCGLDDEDCNLGTHGDLNGDYDDETHDAYNRLIDVDPLYAAKLSEDLATLAIATHHERLDKATTSSTGPKVPRTRKGAPTAPS